MKELKLYVCDKCGTQYKEKQKALDCEKSHAVPQCIINPKYRANSEYPDRITIHFSNGKMVYYTKGKVVN